MQSVFVCLRKEIFENKYATQQLTISMSKKELNTLILEGENKSHWFMLVLK